MELFAEVISVVGYGIETIGVIVIVVGAVRGLLRALADSRTLERDAMFSRFRHDFAQSMMVGLEFLVAGDIIRTVIVAHTLSDLASLGLLVVIRTVLVFTIHLEVERRWPWQPAVAQPPEPGTAGGGDDDGK